MGYRISRSAVLRTRKSERNPSFRERKSLALSVLVGILLFGGCSGDKIPPSDSGTNSAANASTKTAATITASPVPPGGGFATSTISWNTGDGTLGQVYVYDGKSEKLFSEGTAQGSLDAPWIGVGTTYEFRLYAGKDHKDLLASVKVQRAEK